MNPSDLMFRPAFLKDQRILVTGGGSGLGKVMAEACLMLGAQVYICGRRAGVLEQTCAELEQRHGGRIVPKSCDIRDAEAIHKVLDEIWSDGGALTGLINNAAGNFISRTEDLSVRGFDAISNIVFRGTFYMTLECGKRWLAEGVPASVVSILATWVWNGSPFTVPSAMSKAGINAMTQSLAVEWGHRGIRLNAIAPGRFPTEGATARLHPGESVETRVEDPFNRFGRMPELANLAVFLLGPGAEYLNGQTIAIDGADFQATGGNFSKLREWSPEQWKQARAAIEKQQSADRAKRTG
jgi:NAD(P)-dependent dehydrogenase (short-subunit alcohol dehydrogenase family)